MSGTGSTSAASPRQTPAAAMPPWTVTTAGRYRRSRRSPCPRTKKAVISHQPAISPSWKRSEARPKRSPPHPVLSPQVPQPIPAPEERANKQTGRLHRCTSRDNQRTRHRALLTRIFPRHGAALNGKGQGSKCGEGRKSARHQAHNSSATPGGRLQRPRRPGQSPQWADTGDHDGRRVPRTKRAGISHHPAVSYSWMRSEVGPTRMRNK